MTLWLDQTDRFLVIPDKASDIDQAVTVEGEDTRSEDTVEIVLLDVLVRRASRLELLLAFLQPDGSTLLEEQLVNPFGQSDGERRESGLNEMARSQRIATILAFAALGYDLPINRRGVEIMEVMPESPASSELQPGDVIVEAAGRSIRSPNGLRAALASVEPGKRVSLTVVAAGGASRVLSLATRESQDTPGRAIRGVFVAPAIRLASNARLPVEVEIDTDRLQGPSAGLALALEIVDELDGRTFGYDVVAATGEVAVNGTVRPVGGVRQKAVSAREAGAEILLVPEANAAQARRHAGEVRVVAVRSFAEALAAAYGS